MNISHKKCFLCQFAHSLWNLIVSIGRKFTADPVWFYCQKWKCSDLSKLRHDFPNLPIFPNLCNDFFQNSSKLKKCPNFSGLLPVSLWIRPNSEYGKFLCLLYRFIIQPQILVVSTRKKVSRYGVIYYRVHLCKNSM